MNVDREVAEQLSAVDSLLPALVITAGSHSGNLR